MNSCHDTCLPFFIYDAAGSNFILVDNTKGQFNRYVDNQEFIAKLCETNANLEGLMDISLPTGEKHQGQNVDFMMRYFNADGKEGTLCGNGCLAAVAFAQDLGLFSGVCTHFLACDGVHTASSDEASNQVSLKLNNVTGITKYSDTDYFADTGSPHFVRYVDDLQSYDVMAHGSRIRYDEKFDRIGGTNVNFIQPAADGDPIKIRTYQRGNEAELDSCGTGSVAAALVHYVYCQSLRSNTSNFSLGSNESKPDQVFLNDETEQVATHFKSIGGSLGVRFQVAEIKNAMALNELVFEDIYLVGVVKLIKTFSE